MGLVDFLRKASFKRELQKAEVSKRKVKAKVKKFAEIDEMKKRLENARGVKGLSKAEKESLKKRIDRIEARKKEIKKSLSVIGRELKKGTISFLHKVDKGITEMGEQSKPRRRVKPKRKVVKKRSKKKISKRKRKN